MPIEFQIGVIERLPFPDQTFDVVLSTLMMHHLPDPLKRQGLSEIARVLKPGGRLVIADFTHKRNERAVLHNFMPGEAHARFGCPRLGRQFRTCRNGGDASPYNSLLFQEQVLSGLTKAKLIWIQREQEALSSCLSRDEFNLLSSYLEPVNPKRPDQLLPLSLWRSVRQCICR